MEQQQVKYNIKPPFRFVEEYDYVYKTYTKARWLHKKIYDVFTSEYFAYTPEYYKFAFQNGKITVNQKPVSQDYILQDSDCIEHSCKRFEPPILDILPEVLYDDEEYLVVNKPPTYTVHTGGGYHYNTLVGILQNVMGYNKQLYPLHRLDKLTSGLLIISKNGALVTQFHKQKKEFEDQLIEKVYLARVGGDFKYDSITIDKPIYCSNFKQCIQSVCSNNEEEIKKCNAKQAVTVIKKLWYDKESDSSLLECRPKTGRTHQIRVHLSDLGYPILNDKDYGGKFIGNFIVAKHWPELFSKSDSVVERNIIKTQILKEKEQAMKEQLAEEKCLQLKQQEELQKQEQTQEKVEAKGQKDSKCKEYDKEEVKSKEECDVKETEQIKKKIKNTETKETNIIHSQEHPKTQTVDYEQYVEDNLRFDHRYDYKNHVMEIFLYAKRYQINEKIFIAPPPYWAEKQLPKLYQSDNTTLDKQKSETTISDKPQETK